MRKIIYIVTICICCLFSCIQTTRKNENIKSYKIKEMNQDDLETTIIRMERNALEKLNKGNPSGYLEIYADNITYFDPFQEKRFDGFENVKTFYESMQGTINIENYEMINPVVQIIGKTAILSYNLASHIGEGVFREKCTEVYSLQPNKQWKIVHSHWSIVTSASEK